MTHRSASATVGVRASWAFEALRGARGLWLFARCFGLQRLAGGRISDQRIGRWLRHGLERLGMTYVKLGQYLALRLDIVAPGVADELSHLFEQVAPMPFDAVRTIVEDALGRPLDACFESFATEPLGSASIAQVHAAVTRNGRRAAVKIKRAGIDRLFAADIRNLQRIARVLDALNATTTPLGPVVDQFDAFTRRELDLSEEARTVDLIRASRPPRIHIPAVYHELCAPEVLTTELIDGISFDRICQLHERGRGDEVFRQFPGVDLRRAFADVIGACMYLTFQTGRFHGDPHPGNLLLRRDNSVAFVDFGIYGELAPDQQRTFAHYLWAVAMGRPHEAARVHDRMCVPTRRTDMRRFHAELAAVLRQWYAATTGTAPKASTQRTLGGVYGALLDTMRRNAVRTQPEQILLWRSLALLDLTAARWPVPIDSAREMVRYFQRHPMDGRRPLARMAELATDVVATQRAVNAAIQSSRRHPKTLRIQRSAESQPRGEHVVVAASAVLALTLAGLSAGGTIGRVAAATALAGVSAVVIRRLQP